MIAYSTVLMRLAAFLGATLLVAGGTGVLGRPPIQDVKIHEETWVSGPNLMCGGYGGFTTYRTTVLVRYAIMEGRGRRLLEAVARVSSPTFAEHPQNDVSVLLEVLQGSRVLSRATLAPAPPEAASSTRAADDARPSVLPAGVVVTVPRGATVRATVTPQVMIDLPGCIPARCVWCGMGSSTHVIVLP